MKRSAPSVKRIVVTSSFASILDASKFTDPSTTFTEASWNPVGIDNIHESPATAYRASKVLAEHAAWDFVRDEKPNFDLVTVAPPAVFGPVVHHLASLDNINTSNERFVNLLRGKWKEEIPEVTPVPIWVDVRDVAKAHIRAFEEPLAGGKRLFTVTGFFNHRDAVEIVRSKFPEFSDKLPGTDVEGGASPPDDQVFKINNEKTREILGFEWIPFEKSIADLVISIKPQLA